jgi:hypothetical protein
MATINLSVSDYIASGYVSDYTSDGASLSLSASAELFLDTPIVRLGSTQWDECGTWATWPKSKWSPGVEAQLSVSSSADAVAIRGITAQADMSLTSDATGSAIFGPTINFNTSLTADTTLSAIFSMASASNMSLTASGFAGRIRPFTSASELVLTAIADGRNLRGLTAAPELVITSDANAVVRLTLAADSNLSLTAQALMSPTFLLNAQAQMNLTMFLGGGVFVGPPDPARTFTLDGETRIHVVPLDQVNDTSGQHYGHGYYKIHNNNSESRRYQVLTDTRVATVKDATRIQPAEVY